MRAGSEEYLRLGEVRAQAARARRPAAAADRAAQPDPPRQRRAPASSTNITFLTTENDALIAYAKQRPANTVIVVVNLDPASGPGGRSRSSRRSSACRRASTVADLLDGERYEWRLGRNYVRLDPASVRPTCSRCVRADRPAERRATDERAATLARLARERGRGWTGARRPRADRAVVRGRPAVVQARRLLRDPRARLLRRQRRRLGRLPRPDREARLPRSGSGSTASGCCRSTPRRCATAATTSPTSRTVHPDYGTVEDVRSSSTPPTRGDPRDRRPRDEPHLERPPVVPGVALRARTRPSATGTSGRTPTTATPTRGSSSSTPRPRTGPGTRWPAPTTGTASSPTSPTSTTTTRRCRRRCSTCSASGSTSASTASASTRCPTCSSARAPTARTCPRRTPSSGACARRSTREYPDRVLLAEANQWPADVVEYFGDGDECHMAFHFPVMPRMFMALRREEAAPIFEILEQHAGDPRQLPVGPVPAQPRRADARDGHRRGARLHVRRVRARTRG